MKPLVSDRQHEIFESCKLIGGSLDDHEILLHKMLEKMKLLLLFLNLQSSQELQYEIDIKSNSTRVT